MRKTQFVEGEYYHIYNRGVEKRDIFKNIYDLQRFFQSMVEFNVSDPIGSIYENQYRKRIQKQNNILGNPVTKLQDEDKLVNFITYCLNTNHYHFILEPACDSGVKMFMQKLGTGYTRYFNEKYKRNGVLFQGPYKARHIETNGDLLHLSAYVNLNDRIHGNNQLGNPVTKSSWGEYIGENSKNSGSGENSESINSLCSKDIILGQFNGIRDYKTFAEETMTDIIRRRRDDREEESMDLLLE